MSPGKLMSAVEPWQRRLFLPAYTVADAARYVGTTTSTVSRWYFATNRPGPTLRGRERGTPLSYLQLVEVRFVATFRALGVPLDRTRKAREYLGQMFQAEYPFAELRLKTEGHHVLMELKDAEPDIAVDRLIVADAGGQLAWKAIIAERFEEFDYEHDLAVRWHLRGRRSPIVIDPRISFGAPAIRGIPTWALKGRWKAGESLDELADDFGLPEKEVRAALEFEEAEKAA